MALTNAHQTSLNNVTTSATTLDGAVANYVAAKAQADAANAALVASSSALDAAWSDFKAKEGAFSTSMLTAPAGYTPPTT